MRVVDDSIGASHVSEAKLGLLDRVMEQRMCATLSPVCIFFKQEVGNEVVMRFAIVTKASYTISRLHS